MRVIEAEFFDKNANAELNERPAEISQMAREGIASPNEERIDGREK